MQCVCACCVLHIQLDDKKNYSNCVRTQYNGRRQPNQNWVFRIFFFFFNLLNWKMHKICFNDNRFKCTTALLSTEYLTVILNKWLVGYLFAHLYIQRCAFTKWNAMYSVHTHSPNTHNNALHTKIQSHLTYKPISVNSHVWLLNARDLIHMHHHMTMIVATNKCIYAIRLIVINFRREREGKKCSHSAVDAG